MTVDVETLVESFRRNGEGRSSGGARDLGALVEDTRAYLRDGNIGWPSALPWRRREVLAREFTIVRAHICGIPLGPYGTPGHRDLARKAERLTTMERDLLQGAPGFEPAAYVDALITYWTTLASKHATYRFLAVLLETLSGQE